MPGAKPGTVRPALATSQVPARQARRSRCRSSGRSSSRASGHDSSISQRRSCSPPKAARCRS